MGQRHCINLDISRKLHHDARRSYIQDSLISEFEGKILVLAQESQSTKTALSAELSIERQKNDLLKQNAISYQQMNNSYEAETKYLKKRERKARRERNVAIGIGAILIVMAVVK